MEREKQIEEILNDIRNHCTKDKHCGAIDCAKCLAEHLTEQGYRKETQGEWISVEDRLPETEGKYLVHTQNGYIWTSYYYTTNANGFEYWDVTHWMPLPTPPKMKGAE